MAELLEPIRPTAVRYIKLGRGGRWVNASLDHGEVHFGYKRIPHEVALRGDWKAVHNAVRAGVRTEGKAKDQTREIQAFYEKGPDCLWITIERGHVWWAYAHPEVVWHGEDDAHGARFRRTIGPWRNHDIHGGPLRVDRLSTRLTSVAAYRGTICRVKEVDYLLRRVNAEDEPLLLEAQAVRDQMVTTAEKMIASLHWSDFETMVDILFTRNGWHRRSTVGGTMKDVDLILENPVSGETGFVQVKSAARISVYRDYVRRFEEDKVFDRMFFICHSPEGGLMEAHGATDSRIHLWVGRALADRVVKAGLYDWLLEKTR
jgi:hypothetical protein